MATSLCDVCMARSYCNMERSEMPECFIPLVENGGVKMSLDEFFKKYNNGVVIVHNSDDNTDCARYRDLRSLYHDHCWDYGRTLGSIEIDSDKIEDRGNLKVVHIWAKRREEDNKDKIILVKEGLNLTLDETYGLIDRLPIDDEVFCRALNETWRIRGEYILTRRYLADLLHKGRQISPNEIKYILEKF